MTHIQAPYSSIHEVHTFEIHLNTAPNFPSPFNTYTVLLAFLFPTFHFIIRVKKKKKPKNKKANLPVREVAAPPPGTAPPRRSPLRRLPVLASVEPLLADHRLAAALHVGRLRALRPRRHSKVPVLDPGLGLLLLYFLPAAFSLPFYFYFFVGAGRGVQGSRGGIFFSDTRRRGHTRRNNTKPRRWFSSLEK